MWRNGLLPVAISKFKAAAIQAIENFCQEPFDTSLESESIEYSKEAFVKKILQFIVGDDQVSAFLAKLMLV